MPDPSILSSTAPLVAPRSVTVIAPPAVHASVRARFAPETSVRLFADAEVVDATALVIASPPSIVAIEHGFSCTVRGRALINTLLGEESLAGCEIRVFDRAAAAGSEAFDLDPACRRACDRGVLAHVEAQVDGRPVTLVDISPLGAQLLSATIVKPNQRVRVILSRDEQDAVRSEATAVWTTFELPAGQPPRYRVGVAFVPARRDDLTTFLGRIVGDR